MASMGRARGAVDAVGGCCAVDAAAVACAGGASLAATGDACCAFSPGAGEAAELEAAEAALMAAAQMLVRYGLQVVSTAQLISNFCVAKPCASASKSSNAATAS